MTTLETVLSILYWIGALTWGTICILFVLATIKKEWREKLDAFIKDTINGARDARPTLSKLAKTYWTAKDGEEEFRLVESQDGKQFVLFKKNGEWFYIPTTTESILWGTQPRRYNGTPQ